MFISFLFAAHQLLIAVNALPAADVLYWLNSVKFKSSLPIFKCEFLFGSLEIASSWFSLTCLSSMFGVDIGLGKYGLCEATSNAICWAVKHPSSVVNGFSPFILDTVLS